MRRPAKRFALARARARARALARALALALTIAPLTTAVIAAAPASATVIQSTNETHTNAAPASTNETHTNAARVPATNNAAHPNTGQWVFITDLPDELWICQYEGNQLVESGKYVSYSCLAGPPGQLALWALTA